MLTLAIISLYLGFSYITAAGLIAINSEHAEDTSDKALQVGVSFCMIAFWFGLTSGMLNLLS